MRIEAPKFSPIATITVGGRNIVFNRLHDSGIDVGSDHFMTQPGKIGGEVRTVNAETDYQIAHSIEGKYQLIIRLSVGSETGVSLRRPTTDDIREMMPTRPRNIAEHRTSDDGAERSEVTPSDDPTVNSADSTSKSNAFGDSSGSSHRIIRE